MQVIILLVVFRYDSRWLLGCGLQRMSWNETIHKWRYCTDFFAFLATTGASSSSSASSSGSVGTNSTVLTFLFCTQVVRIEAEKYHWENLGFVLLCSPLVHPRAAIRIILLPLGFGLHSSFEPGLLIPKVGPYQVANGPPVLELTKKFDIFLNLKSNFQQDDTARDNATHQGNSFVD